MRHRFYWILTVLLFVVACGDAEPTPAPATNTPAPTSTTIPTLTPTPVPTATPMPTQTPTPALPTPGEVYRAVAPSIAFIDTEVATGSGVLIEGNYVVTNAHVAWPYNEIRIVFGDGSEFLNVPVIGWDLMTDLAVAGPIETDLQPLSLTNGEQLEIGSDVYLIGFPGEVEHFPQPAITRGLISVLREWDSAELTYFQSDADIAGGQSGGAFVSATGDIIGISGFGFTEADFALVASSKDLKPLVDALIAGDALDRIIDRPYAETGGAESPRVVLENEWDSAEFLLYPDDDVETVELTLSGGGDGVFEVFDQFGNSVVYADEEVEDDETATFDVLDSPPYFLQITSYEENRTAFTMRSDVPLIPIDDTDDNLEVTAGETVYGNIDYPADIDLFVIELAEGDEINIEVDSAPIDPFVSVVAADGSSELLTNDDGGGGLFGLDAEITYRAETEGLHYIIVESAVVAEVGGYILQIAEPTQFDPTPAAPDPTATPRPSTNAVNGKLSTYIGDASGLSIRYPAPWDEDEFDVNPLAEVFCTEVTVCFVGSDGVLAIEEEDLVDFESVTLESYVESVIDNLESSDLDAEIGEVIDFTTDDGLEGQRWRYVIPDLFSAERLTILTETHAFNATFLIFDEDVDLEDVIESAFQSISTEE